MSTPALADRREQLFKAAAILHVVEHALASRSEGFDPDECAAALGIVHEMIDDVAAALEAAPKSDHA